QIDLFRTRVFGLVISQLGVGDRRIAIELARLEREAVAALVEPFDADKRMLHLIDIQQGFEKGLGLVDRRQLNFLYRTGSHFALAIQLVEEVLVIEIGEDLVRADGLGIGLGLGDRDFIGRLVIGPYIL